VRAGWWRLLSGHTAAHYLQIQPTFLGHFDRRPNTFVQERWHHDPALLHIQHNRTAGGKMNWDSRYRIRLCVRRRELLSIGRDRWSRFPLP
jgi:hypothetical protein